MIISLPSAVRVSTRRKKRGEIRPLLNFSPYIILPVLVLVLLRYDEQHIYSTSVKKHALGLPPLTVTIGSLSQRATNREAVERRRRKRGRGTEGGGGCHEEARSQ